MHTNLSIKSMFELKECSHSPLQIYIYNFRYKISTLSVVRYFYSFFVIFFSNKEDSVIEYSCGCECVEALFSCTFE